MKFLIMGIFVGTFAYTPIYLMDKFVDPQLNDLYYTYSHAEDIANNAAGVNN